jgi:hypothetical protein
MPEAVLLLLLLAVTPPGQGTEDQHHLAAQNFPKLRPKDCKVGELKSQKVLNKSPSQLVFT